MREQKTLKLAELKIAGADGDAGSFEGYASRFGTVDSYGDTIDPGAYTDTIPQFLTRGFIGWGHDWNDPIGIVTRASEDNAGLLLAGDFHSDAEAQKFRTRARERVAAGKFMGLSIGYEAQAWEMRTIDTPYRDAMGELTDRVRALTKIKLYEVSIVTVPAERDSGMTSVKGQGDATKRAIGSHSTSTSDGSWDGPAHEARLSTDAGASTYRKAYAWADPEGDPDTKAAYRFIHHEISSDGAVGAANVRALITGIGVLNGGRGGTTIPEADKQGVYNHLAKHLRDAEREPPPLKSLAGLSYADHAEHVLADVQALFSRSTDLAALRAKEGRELSESNRRRLRALVDALEGLGPLKSDLEELLSTTEKATDPRGLFMEFQRTLARLNAR